MLLSTAATHDRRPLRTSTARSTTSRPTHTRSTTVEYWTVRWRTTRRQKRISQTVRRCLNLFKLNFKLSFALLLGFGKKHFLFDLKIGFSFYLKSSFFTPTALNINPGDYITLKRRADVRGLLNLKSDAVDDYQKSLQLFEMIRRYKQ